MKASYAFKDNTADVNFNGFQTHGFEGEVLRLLPRNSFLVANVLFERQHYDTVDPFVTTVKDRKDNDWNIGLTFGIPFGDAVAVVHDFMNDGEPKDTGVPKNWRDVLFSVSASYTMSDSNIPNYDYNNYRLQALFTKRWAF